MQGVTAGAARRHVRSAREELSMPDRPVASRTPTSSCCESVRLMEALLIWMVPVACFGPTCSTGIMFHTSKMIHLT